MASVPLKFIPPEDDDIVTLRIFESDNALSGFVEIDHTPAGTYPNYITEYTTQLAGSATDWFAIQWENSKGAKTELSAPIKGGTITLVGELIERVLRRQPGLSEEIVLEEAEATVSFVYGVNDPYSIDINIVSPLWLTELANLTMVAALYVDVTQKSTYSQDYTAGMISERTSIDTRLATDSLEKLERRSLRRLGIGGSLIASIKETHPSVITVTGAKTAFDSSRVLSARAIITEDLLVRDLNTGSVISNE